MKINKSLDRLTFEIVGQISFLLFKRYQHMKDRDSAFSHWQLKTRKQNKGKKKKPSTSAIQVLGVAPQKPVLFFSFAAPETS